MPIPPEIALLLDDFPDDEIADLLSPLRAAGHVVRDREANGVVEYETRIDGHRDVTDHAASCALLIACGYDLE